MSGRVGKCRSISLNRRENIGDVVIPDWSLIGPLQYFSIQCEYISDASAIAQVDLYVLVAHARLRQSAELGNPLFVELETHCRCLGIQVRGSGAG